MFRSSRVRLLSLALLFSFILNSLQVPLLGATQLPEGAHVKEGFEQGITWHTNLPPEIEVKNMPGADTPNTAWRTPDITPEAEGYEFICWCLEDISTTGFPDAFRGLYGRNAIVTYSQGHMYAIWRHADTKKLVVNAYYRERPDWTEWDIDIEGMTDPTNPGNFLYTPKADHPGVKYYSGFRPNMTYSTQLNSDNIENTLSDMKTQGDRANELPQFSGWYAPAGWGAWNTYPWVGSTLQFAGESYSMTKEVFLIENTAAWYSCFWWMYDEDDIPPIPVYYDLNASPENDEKRTFYPQWLDSYGYTYLSAASSGLNLQPGRNAVPNTKGYKCNNLVMFDARYDEYDEELGQNITKVIFYEDNLGWSSPFYKVNSIIETEPKECWVHCMWQLPNTTSFEYTVEYSNTDERYFAECPSEKPEEGFKVPAPTPSEGKYIKAGRISYRGNDLTEDGRVKFVVDPHIITNEDYEVNDDNTVTLDWAPYYVYFYVIEADDWTIPAHYDNVNVDLSTNEFTPTDTEYNQGDAIPKEEPVDAEYEFKGWITDWRTLETNESNYEQDEEDILLLHPKDRMTEVDTKDSVNFYPLWQSKESNILQNHVVVRKDEISTPDIFTNATDDSFTLPDELWEEANTDEWDVEIFYLDDEDEETLTYGQSTLTADDLTIQLDKEDCTPVLTILTPHEEIKGESELFNIRYTTFVQPNTVSNMPEDDIDLPIVADSEGNYNYTIKTDVPELDDYTFKFWTQQQVDDNTVVEISRNPDETVVLFDKNTDFLAEWEDNETERMVYEVVYKNTDFKSEYEVSGPDYVIRSDTPTKAGYKFDHYDVRVITYEDRYDDHVNLIWDDREKPYYPGDTIELYDQDLYMIRLLAVYTEEEETESSTQEITTESTTEEASETTTVGGGIIVDAEPSTETTTLETTTETTTEATTRIQIGVYGYDITEGDYNSYPKNPQESLDTFGITLPFKTLGNKPSHHFTVPIYDERTNRLLTEGVDYILKYDTTQYPYYFIIIGLNDYEGTVVFPYTVDNSSSSSGSISGGSSGGGGSGGSSSNKAAVVREPDTDDRGHGNTSSPKDKHILYINGYPDGTFRASNNITRAEVATIFSKVLDLNDTKKSFPDVAPEMWYTNNINICAGNGIITGYPDGTFKPDRPITRAEFVTMVAKTYDLPADRSIPFNDITGHWAQYNITAVAGKEWIVGYTDGGFHPNDFITRAEAVTIVNAMLDRHCQLDDKLKFSDISQGYWAYNQILEASITHTVKEG